MSSNKIQKSIGWSLFSEIAVKFVVPITNMILARVLTPDAFGVVAVCNMLISFVDLITDAGFGKYIVQHDFENDKDKENYINVSFWYICCNDEPNNNFPGTNGNNAGTQGICKCNFYCQYSVNYNIYI